MVCTPFDSKIIFYTVENLACSRKGIRAEVGAMMYKFYS